MRNHKWCNRLPFSFSAGFFVSIWERRERGRSFQFLIAPGKTPDAAYRAIYILLLRLLSSRIRIMRVLPHPGSHNLVPWPKIRFPLATLFNAINLILSRSKWPRLKFSLNLSASLRFRFELSPWYFIPKGKQQSLSILFPFSSN